MTSIHVGSNPGSTGTYNLIAGSLTVSGDGSSELAARSAGNSDVGGNQSSVPEPSTLLLVFLTVTG